MFSGAPEVAIATAATPTNVIAGPTAHDGSAVATNVSTLSTMTAATPAADAATATVHDGGAARAVVAVVLPSSTEAAQCPAATSATGSADTVVDPIAAKSEGITVAAQAAAAEQQPQEAALTETVNDAWLLVAKDVLDPAGGAVLNLPGVSTKNKEEPGRQDARAAHGQDSGFEEA